MTGTMSPSPIKMHVAEIEAIAANWIATQYDSGAWTKENQAALDAWIAEATDHEVAYLRLEAAWSRADRLVAINHLSFGTEDNAPRNRLGSILRAVVGLIAVAVIGVGVVQYYSRPDLQSFATPVGGHEKITLLDGSQIELNTDTRLHADIDRAGDNTIWLDKGEAYFEIKHNPARRFVVMASGLRVTDLGTKFRLKNWPGQTEVALLSGRINVESASPGSHAGTATLRPGDVITENSGRLQLTHADEQELSNELGWRKGVVIFENTTLAEAASELNRYNTRQIIIADSATARRRIAGTFRTNDISGFAVLAQDVLKLNVVNDANMVVISR